jgi:hypothetical protein
LGGPQAVKAGHIEVASRRVAGSYCKS